MAHQSPFSRREALSREEHGEGVPGYVELEFRRCLECGIHLCRCACRARSHRLDGCASPHASKTITLIAKPGVTVTDITRALRAQNTVNPAGQIGGEPVPPGQEFTYTVRAPGRLASVEEFEQIVVRANPDGTLLRVKDVARIELGAQTYNQSGRLDGKASAVLSLYQLPAPMPSRPPKAPGR